MALSGSRGSKSRHSEPATSATSDHGPGHSRVRARDLRIATSSLGDVMTCSTYSCRNAILLCVVVFTRPDHATVAVCLLFSSAVLYWRQR